MSDYFLTASGKRFVRQQVADLPVLQTTFTVPPASAGNFIITEHDYQTAEANPERPYHPRKAATQTEVPETFNLMPADHNEFLPLTLEVAEFYLATLRIPYPQLTRDEAIERWHQLTKNSVCFTDKRAWNTGDVIGDPSKNYHDVLYGSNPQNPVMAWKIGIATCGNIFRKLSGSIIEAIDPYQRPFPDPATLYAAKPWLFFWATQCYMQETGRMELIDGKMRKQYKVSRFPHFAPTNVLVPLMGIGGQTRIVETWRIRNIENGEAYSPYVL